MARSSPSTMPARHFPVILVTVAAVLVAVTAALEVWVLIHPPPVRITQMETLIRQQAPTMMSHNAVAAALPSGRGIASVTVPPPQAAPPLPVAAAAPPPAPVDLGHALAINMGAAVIPSAPSYSAFGARHGLLPAPDTDLIERGPYGFMPLIGPDGRQPWQVYARPFDLTDTTPRVAIIVTGLAIASQATKNAIDNTPPETTLAFAPFGRHLGDWANLARASGHEVLLELPMEPVDYPQQDPGFNTLLTAYDPPQNLDRLHWVYSQAAGFTGLIGRMGGKFQASRGDIAPIIDDIAKRGLLFVDNRETLQSVVPQLAAANKMPFAQIDRVIDADPNHVAIDQALIDLTTQALRTGHAVGLASAAPATLQEINVWVKTLADRGVVLAPVSAVVATITPAAAAPPAATPLVAPDATDATSAPPAKPQ